MSGRRPEGWELHEQPDGTYDVKLDGRPVQRDCEDLDDAVQSVRTSRDYERGAPVALVELDGYRTILVGR